MCGIFGLLADRVIDPALYIHLGLRNTERGNLGFGGLLRSQAGGLQIFRHATPFDPTRLKLDGRITALGHVRAPTGGQSDALAEIHPFESADFFLAHNGMILNHAEFPEWRLNPAIHVDSQIILGGIQAAYTGRASVVEAIRATVERLDGQQACWLWHKATSTVYLWRVMAPIYVTETSSELRFSSVCDDLAQTLIPEGTIYRLDGFKCLKVSNFTYYNPFKVK
jgi:glutamine phosphoribosylpyrophosphate amidotransferase